jgi:cytochrome P450
MTRSIEATDRDLFAQVMDYTNRANPYPLYARLRETPVVRADDGLYIVSTYEEIRSLLFHPKASSHVVSRPRFPRTGNLFTDWIMNPIKARIAEKHRSLVFRDPPEHDGLRRHIMLQFTPERMQRMKGRVAAIIDELIAGIQGRRQIDLVEAFSYPLPVAVICELLGVPAKDERKFHAWSKSLIAGLDPEQHLTEADLQKLAVNNAAISAYLGALIKEKRRRPSDDVLTGLATCRDKKAGRLNHFDLITTAVSLLVAGHETTVCLINNGMLTLLRQPEILTRLRLDPDLAPRLVEELLRFDPPAQFMRRKALDDIDIARVRIPKGAMMVLLVASGNRDPKRFTDPDRFDPDRKNNQNFGFGAGLHACLGAWLARMETEAALAALSRRLINPSLAEDPPSYRSTAVVRGPERLLINIEGVT